jgi:SAM-dependent methyltransferase
MSAAVPPWAQDVFVSDLLLLGEVAAGAAVWTVTDDASTATISDQFRANAGDYHARYAASGHFEKLFTDALAATGVQVGAAPKVLDLGSGSGVNSVVPCLRLFPGAQVVATDLSAELLAILASSLAELGAEGQVTCVVMDAMADHVAPGAFDLVTGAAILHHLIDPDLGLRAAARALKPGGQAIFFEPFDGYGLIRLAYQRILAEGRLRSGPLRGRGLDPRIESALRAISVDIAARTEPDPSAPHFPHLDDKWLFSQERITTAARAHGFAKVEFVPHNDQRHLYREIARIQLRLATGLDTLVLPAWALDILEEFDAALPSVVKRRAMLEGTIVLTRSAEALAAA